MIVFTCIAVIKLHNPTKDRFYKYSINCIPLFEINNQSEGMYGDQTILEDSTNSPGEPAFCK